MTVNNMLQFCWCRFSDSIDDLRMMYEKLERKIAKKRKANQDSRDKLTVEPCRSVYAKAVCVVIAESSNVVITI